jgi:DNA-binding LacI/PurR family transcriptional regulator
MRSEKRPSAVTMADVAARAGVSRALVSIVFRDVPGASAVTRKRVMRAAEELAYRPDQRARLLGSNRSRTVGVTFGLHHEFHAEVVEGLYGAVEGTGYDLALGPVAPIRDERRAVQSLLDFRCEALILIGTTSSRSILEELAEHLPVVVVARALRSQTVNVVRGDDVAGARLAVEHLVGLGHERITHVHGQRAPGAAERRRGYLDAMRAAGLDSQVRLVPGGLTEEDGEHAAALLLVNAVPTAVTAFNDHCAAGLMAAARARGATIPGSLSVVGYDDSHIASLSSVALTTIAQDAPKLATSALDLALAHIERGSDKASEVVVPPRLVVRSTSAAPAEEAVQQRDLSDGGVAGVGRLLV